MEYHLNITGLFKDEEELRATVKKWRICYDTEPCYCSHEQGSLTQIGFQINLYGTFPDTDEEESLAKKILRREFDAVLRDVRKVVEALKKSGESLYMGRNMIKPVAIMINRIITNLLDNSLKYTGPANASGAGLVNKMLAKARELGVKIQLCTKDTASGRMEKFDATSKQAGYTGKEKIVMNVDNNFCLCNEKRVVLLPLLEKFFGCVGEVAKVSPMTKPDYILP